jgi:hypothetical protein
MGWGARRSLAATTTARPVSGRGKLSAPKSSSGKRPEDYRVVLQDIGDPLTRMPWPPTPEKLVDASITPLRDSAIDVYAYGVHHAGGTTHCSTAYPIIGEDQATLRSASALRMNRAVHQLCEEGHDPIKVMADGAHAAGMDFFLRMRMNDLHDRVGDTIEIDKPSKLPKTGHIEPYYYTPQWKRDHPEWLIGDPQAPHRAFSFEFMEAKAGNYAIGEFRQMMYSLAAEAVNGYDLDGFEVDFIRFPYFFPRAEAYAQRHVMTAFLRKIRALTKERGTSRGTPVFFSARVPCTVELCLRVGLDLPLWLKEGLLDMVVIGGGYVPFSTPWKDIGDLAQKAGIPALACFNTGAARGMSRPPEASPKLQREHVRAAAYRALSSGMSGIHLWNFFYEMESYYRPGQEHLGYSFTHDIADRDFLRTARKTYTLDAGVGSRLFDTYAHANSPNQIPLTIGRSVDGIGHVLVFDIADDLRQADNAEPIQLWLNVVDLSPEDQLEFRWNGRKIERNPGSFPGVTVFDSLESEFDLDASQVRRGENQLEIRLLKRNSRLEPFVSLVNARLTIPQLS